MEDALVEIFSGLPKKSQLRCEAVCKTWQILIKENGSAFAAAASGKSMMDQYGSIVLNESSERRRPRFSRFDKEGCLLDEHTINLESIVGSLCRNASSSNPVVFYCTEEEMPNRHRSYHVYNPLTLHHTVIPPINASSSTKSYHVAPFPILMGYAPCSQKEGHFKFVVATYQVEVVFFPPKIDFSIFDSETGIWETEQPKKCSGGRGRQTDGRNFPGVVDFMDVCPPCLSLHGDLFWLQGSCIFAFTMKTWTARRIELPHSPTDHRGCFWESEGRLKYCQILPTHLGFCIWVLEGRLNNGGNYKWRQIFSLSRHSLNSLLIQAGREPYCAEGTWVTAFDEDHGIIHLQTPQGLLSYHISEKRFTPITAISSSKRPFCFWGHQPFTIDRPSSRKRKAEICEDAIPSHVSKLCKH